MDVVSTTPFPCENSTREEEVSYFDPSAKYVSQSALYNCLVAAIFGLLSVGAVLGNSAAIFLLIRTRDTFLTGNAGKLLVNLALADLVTGCFSTPFRFQMVLFQHWAYGASFCSFSCFVDNWSLFSSVYTLLMIALDRYVAVVTPFSMLFKRVSLKWWIALIWLLSILSAAPATLITRTTDIRNPCDYEDVFRTLCYVDLRYQQAVDMFTLITSYVLPLVLMIMFYAAITRRLIQSSRVVSNTTVLGQTHSARNQKVVRVLVAVVCIFLLCWLPIRLYQVIKFIYPSILKSPLVPKFYLAAYWLGVSNSTWNPIIYSFYFIKNKKENHAAQTIAANDATTNKGGGGHKGGCPGGKRGLDVSCKLEGNSNDGSGRENNNNDPSDKNCDKRKMTLTTPVKMNNGYSGEGNKGSFSFKGSKMKHNNGISRNMTIEDSTIMTNNNHSQHLSEIEGDEGSCVWVNNPERGQKLFFSDIYEKQESSL